MSRSKATTHGLRCAATTLLLGIGAASCAMAQSAPLKVSNAARFLDVLAEAQEPRQPAQVPPVQASQPAQAARLASASRSAHAALTTKTTHTTSPPVAAIRPKFGQLDRSSCYNSCINGLCKRTLASGHIETWQAPGQFSDDTQQWTWDTKTNACGTR